VLLTKQQPVLLWRPTIIPLSKQRDKEQSRLCFQRTSTRLCQHFVSSALNTVCPSLPLSSTKIERTCSSSKVAAALRINILTYKEKQYNFINSLSPQLCKQRSFQQIRNNHKHMCSSTNLISESSHRKHSTDLIQFRTSVHLDYLLGDFHIASPTEYKTFLHANRIYLKATLSTTNLYTAHTCVDLPHFCTHDAHSHDAFYNEIRRRMFCATDSWRYMAFRVRCVTLQ
jgi:hypothetical protein